MITKEGLLQRHNELVNYAKQKSSGFRSIPKPLFVGVKFNPDNWNGGDAIIRQFTYYLEDEGRYAREFDWEYMSGDFISSHNWFNDQNYINIILHVYDERINKWILESYLITYYKNRGKTEVIYKNGKLIALDEYIELLNIIESTGFKFDMTT